MGMRSGSFTALTDIKEKTLTLAQFDAGLREAMADIPDPRPFVCQGNPLDCDIFIVGFNAATTMAQPFWDFWDPARGFDKEAWFTAYCQDRASRPLKPGRTRRNKVSATRSRIQWVTQGLSPLQALETNIYTRPTPAAADLAHRDRESAVFRFLVETIRPRLLLAHGVEVRRHLETLFHCTIPQAVTTPVTFRGLGFHIHAVPHFSRGWSKVRSIALGESTQATYHRLTQGPSGHPYLPE